MTDFFANKFGKLQRGVFPQFKINELATFPISYAKPTVKKEIISLVDTILSRKKENPDVDITLLDSQIDRLVYGLLNLSPNEIAIVEGK